MAATLLLLLLLFLFFFHTPTIQATFQTSTLYLVTHRPTKLPISNYSTDHLLRPTTAGEANQLVLPLRPRDSIHGTRAENYRQVTLARLERDAARVGSIGAKLNRALGGGAISRPQDMEGTVVSGSKQGSGEYFARVGVGSPPRPAYMALDTGSDITWLQCQPCTDCYSQIDPVFDPAASSTYAPLSCTSAECRALDVAACRSGGCIYQVSYGDGSYTTGDFASDTITFGSFPAVRTPLGCGHDNEGLFVAAAGLLGLGGGPLSFPTQTKSSTFSYCLVDRDSSSSSTLDFGSSATATGITASLLHNPKIDTYHYVDLTGVSVGGQPLPISSSSLAMDAGTGRGGVIVDSGTAVTRLPAAVYNALRDAFAASAGHLRGAGGFSLFDTCYNLAGMGRTVQVPAVALLFGGGRRLDLPAKNFMTAVDSSGTYCLAFAPSSAPVSIIGNIQQQGIRVGFDLANSVVTFAPNSC